MLIGLIGVIRVQNYNQGEAAQYRARALSLDVDMTFVESLAILKRHFFWAIFVANLVGLGGGFLILSQVNFLWSDFDVGPNQSDPVGAWDQRIIYIFSVFNAVANVAAPTVSGYLHDYGKLSRAHLVALILFLMCVDFTMLGVLSSVQSLREGAWALKIVYIIGVAFVGFGFGAFLTLIPAILSDVYGVKNFGVFMSYVQLGSMIAGVAVPAIASGVHAKWGWYSPMHFAFAGCFLIATIMMSCIDSRTRTFGNKLLAEQKPRNMRDTEAGRRHRVRRHGCVWPLACAHTSLAPRRSKHGRSRAPACGPTKWCVRRLQRQPHPTPRPLLTPPCMCCRRSCARSRAHVAWRAAPRCAAPPCRATAAMRRYRRPTRSRRSALERCEGSVAQQHGMLRTILSQQRHIFALHSPRTLRCLRELGLGAIATQGHYPTLHCRHHTSANTDHVALASNRSGARCRRRARVGGGSGGGASGSHKGFRQCEVLQAGGCLDRPQTNETSVIITRAGAGRNGAAAAGGVAYRGAGPLTSPIDVHAQQCAASVPQPAQQGTVAIPSCGTTK